MGTPSMPSGAGRRLDDTQVRHEVVVVTQIRKRIL